MSYHPSETRIKKWLEKKSEGLVVKLGNGEAADFLHLAKWSSTAILSFVEVKSTKEKKYYPLKSSERRKQVERLKKFVLACQAIELNNPYTITQGFLLVEFRLGRGKERVIVLKNIMNVSKKPIIPNSWDTVQNELG